MPGRFCPVRQAQAPGHPAERFVRFGLNGCAEELFRVAPATSLGGIHSGVVQSGMAAGPIGNPLRPPPVGLS